MTADELLAEARRAWRMRAIADAKLQHLSRYSRLTPAMKDEQSSAYRCQREANETLTRILGGG